MSGSYFDTFDMKGWNLNDHHSLTTRLYSVNIVFLVLLVLFSFARFCARRYVHKAFGADDVLIMAATLCTFSLCAFSIAAASKGLGSHIWDLLYHNGAQQFDKFESTGGLITKILFGSYLSYTTAITLTKTSIIVSLHRLFLTRDLDMPRLRRVVRALFVVVICLWLAAFSGLLLECHPIAAQWDWSLPRKCINILAFFQATAVINFVTDFALLAIPFLVVWKLQMPKQVKVRIYLLFGVPLFACIASTIRLATLRGLIGSDLTYTAVTPLSWSIAEVSTAIICACIPPMKPLYDHFLPQSWRNSYNARPSPPPPPPPTATSSYSTTSVNTFLQYGSAGCAMEDEEVEVEGVSHELPIRLSSLPVHNSAQQAMEEMNLASLRPFGANTSFTRSDSTLNESMMLQRSICEHV